MRSRTLQAHVLLGLVALALTAMAAGKAGADPAARDKWVSDDGSITIESFKGDVWNVNWKDPAKANAGILLVNLTKTTDDAKVLEQKKGDPQITITLGAKEANIETEKAGPPPGKIKGSWK